MTEFLWQSLLRGLLAPESGEGAQTTAVEDAGGVTDDAPVVDPGESAPEAPSSEEVPAKQMVSLETFQKRLGAVTRQREEALRAAQSANAELERVRSEALSRVTTNEDGLPKIIPPPAQPAGRLFTEAEAMQLADQRAAILAFNEKCNEVATAGKKAYGASFDASIAAINSGVGEMSPQFLEAVLETGTASDVIFALGKQLDKAADIMALSPARQGVALAKFAAELAAGKKPAGKKVSEAPDPITPKVGAPKLQGNANLDDENLDMKSWMALRNKQLQERSGRR